MQSKKRLCRLVLAGIAMLGACGAASLVEAPTQACMSIR